MSDHKPSTQHLKRTFGMRECVTVTAGSVIGVGLFVTGANVAGLMGNYVIFATAVALLFTVYPALLYAEMGAALPYSGGTYQYASVGLSKPVGFLAGWNYVIAIVSVSSSESLAFSFYFKTMFSAFGVTLPISDLVIALLCLIIFIVLNMYGVEMTGRMANAFMFFFWGVAIIWFLMMIPNISLPNFVEKPSFMGNGPNGLIANIAMVWWCFAGFETCCGMGEEIKYPHINIPRAMKLTPFVIFAVNALFQWFLVGIVPVSSLNKIAVAAAPYAEAMMTAGILGIPLALLAAGIAFGGGLSTMNSCVSSIPRYLYAMARDGCLPQIFAKVHAKYQTPYVAILFLGGLSLLLVLTNSIDYIASLSLFADLFNYIIGIAAAYGLRKKHPELRRPYQAPAMAIGVPVSILVYLVMMSQLDSAALLSGLAWSVLGLVMFYGYRKSKGIRDEPDISLAPAEPLEEPPADERVKMDREYRIWRAIVALAVLIAAALYIFPYLTAL